MSAPCALSCVYAHAQDDTPDEWVPDNLVAPDLVEDWSKGLERAPVSALLDVQQWGTSREYLVQWADGRPDSWEDEANIPQVITHTHMSWARGGGLNYSSDSSTGSSNSKGKHRRAALQPKVVPAPNVSPSPRC